MQIVIITTASVVLNSSSASRALWVAKYLSQVAVSLGIGSLGRDFKKKSVFTGLCCSNWNVSFFHSSLLCEKFFAELERLQPVIELSNQTGVGFDLKFLVRRAITGERNSILSKHHFLRRVSVKSFLCVEYINVTKYEITFFGMAAMQSHSFVMVFCLKVHLDMGFDNAS